MNTTAQQIADRLNNDGTRWETKEGISFCDLIYNCHHRVTTKGGINKHTFDDGSSILVADGGWDLGIFGSDPDCFCFDYEGCKCDEATESRR